MDAARPGVAGPLLAGHAAVAVPAAVVDVLGQQGRGPAEGAQERDDRVVVLLVIHGTAGSGRRGLGAGRARTPGTAVRAG